MRGSFFPDEFMKLTITPLFAATIGFVALSIGNSLNGQTMPEAVVEATTVVSDSRSDLSLQDVESRLAALEGDTKTEEAVKNVLRPKYQQAIAALKQAAEFEQKTKSFEKAVRSAPAKARMAREELDGLPAVADVTAERMDGKATELQKQMDGRKAGLSVMKKELAVVDANLAKVRSGPQAISARLPKVRQELASVESKLDSRGDLDAGASAGGVADQLLLESQRMSLSNEQEMLLEGQLSLAVREELLLAESELMKRKVEIAGVELQAIAELVNQRLTSEAKQVVSRAEPSSNEIATDDKEAQALAAEVRELAKEFESVVNYLRRVSVRANRLSGRLESLSASYDEIQEHLSLGGGGIATAPILFELRGELPGRHELEYELKEWKGKLDASYLAAFGVDTKTREQSEVEEGFAGHASPAVGQLVDTRGEVLTKLRTQYRNLIRAQAAVLGDGREYMDKVEEVRMFLEEKLFWTRSSPPITFKLLRAVPEGMSWLNSVEHWRELWRAILEVVRKHSFTSVVLALMVATLLFLRGRIKATIKRAGEQVRHISSDRYIFTLQVLFCTILMSLPVPLLLGFMSRALGEVPDPSPWLRGIAQGLRLTASTSFFLLLISETCRRGGLGSVHFGWSAESLALIKRASRWVLIGYVPALLNTGSSLYGDASEYFDSAGRVTFIFAMIWLSFVHWRTLRFSDGLFAGDIREQPSSWVVRLRYLWLSFAVGLPMLLVVLAALGYMITALELAMGLLGALAVVFGGVVIYCVVLRWFMVKERKIALAEALERRRVRQEAADAEAEQSESGEVVAVEQVDEKLALRAISQQTRHLLQFVFVVGGVILIGVLWSRFLPVFSVLGSTPVLGGLSLRELSKALLIVALTVISARNLPGLLELGVFRTTKLDAGTRSAVSTLLQYAVWSIGLAALFGVLHLDWSKFGWIAAALSVGLGFGLQEVVANFVCGLILLFECPIRVGDVVTVEGMSGTVTRIRMRATTIMNWDRQEFVVPNKIIITGTLLNWTLSNEVSRLTISVGVAYGSDTEKAQQILLDVANESPLVIDDPQPMASFEEFADSCLTLRLRTYLPNVDNRIRAMSELHTAIDKRFKEEGIEISFPQRDLHLRSAGDWISKVGVSEES